MLYVFGTCFAATGALRASDTVCAVAAAIDDQVTASLGTYFDESLHRVASLTSQIQNAHGYRPVWSNPNIRDEYGRS